MERRYFIKTFGCQMNEADSLWLTRIFAACGYEKAESLADADVILINSCSVRQAAEDKVYGLAPKISELRGGEFPRAKLWEKPLKLSSFPSPPVVILTGCIVGSASGERRRIKLHDLEERMPWVDYFIPSGEVFRKLPEILSTITAGDSPKPDFKNEKSDRLQPVTPQERSDKLQFVIPSDDALKRVTLEEEARFLSSPAGVVIGDTQDGKEAYVPIMRGCDQFCSYCVVPFGRGPARFRSRGDVISDVKGLVDEGVTRVTLLGQNVNAYPNFAQLLQQLNEVEGLEEIWFITCNPWDVSPDFIEALALPKVKKYLHLALQSGDDEILKKMNRPYTVEEYKDLISRIRDRVPEIELGTDLIVGFPGETEEQFQNTVKAVRDIGFDGAYIAMYSPRPGTAAAERFEDDVPLEEKRRRHAVLTDAVENST